MWWDFFKVFKYAFTDDPLSSRFQQQLRGAGFSQPDAMPDIRGGADGTWGGGRGAIRLRDSNDFVDLSTVTNRIHRYKEYERLRNMAEIEMAMTVFADESCFSGDTQVATPSYGFKSLKWLAENLKDERFLVYCYDFDKEDYTLGWASSPRQTKVAQTVKIGLDDGHYFRCTPDHRILLRNGTWKPAGELRNGDELMPFYRMNARQDFTGQKVNQFPRIYTHSKGWVHERQFVDEWSIGKEDPDLQVVNQYCRMIAQGLSVRKITQLTGNDFRTVRDRIEKAGFSNKEMKWLGARNDKRRVIFVSEGPEIPVYDLSVEKHENFATDWGIVHNCQRDEDGRALQISCKDQDIVDELEYLFFNRKMLNFDQKKVWDRAKQLFIMGDYFEEVVIDPDNPKGGVVNLIPLPADSMYRIETTKGKLVEFQQSKEGPDYQSLARVEVTQATEADLQQATAIRFAPEQIVHTRIGDDRKTFYPYGVSLIEPARGPAHQLRLMEDAMVVYRLCIRTYDKIAIRGGWKYMKDISLNDTIYVFNQTTRKLEEGKVAWHGLVGSKPTYKVRSRHTSVTGTNIHPIIVYDKETEETGYVKIKDIIPGRHYFVRPRLSQFEPKKINRYYKTPFAVLSREQKDRYKNTVYSDKKLLITESLQSIGMETSKKNIQKCWSFLVAKDNTSAPLKLGEALCEHFDLGNVIRKNKGERDPQRINLPEYVNEEFAMLFGFLLGDGCISWNKGSVKLLFAAGTHPDINKRYFDLMTKFFGRCTFQQDKRLDEGLGVYCVNSATACEILENLGFNGKAGEKRIPDWVYLERPEIRKAFVKGFADADGEKRGMSMKSWNTTVTLCNKELVEDIKQVWESLGYHASEVKEVQEPERWIKGGHVSASISWKIYISETAVPFHDEVVSVSRHGKEDVYDLTVEHPTEHNFLCNGVPVSNTRAPERRVFYIDTWSLPPWKAEAFIERMKDQFKKKKVASSRTGLPGASAVEERWHAPAADEDYWVPIRPQTNTRVETLPGAQNLGEIDDTIYFRNKLFTALNFPKNYFNNEDTQSTRITLSAQDVKFARLIERLQSYMEDSFWEICDRHLKLLGYPEETYEDLTVKMTPPSDWRELTRAEVTANRIGNASNLKGSQLMSDYDILIKWMKYDEDEAKKMLARLKIQKLEELKLQIIAQNPTLLGVGLPGPDETEIGVEPGGPNPMLGDEQQPPEGEQPPEGGQPPEEMGGTPVGGPGGPPPMSGSGMELPEPSDEEIERYNLDIKDHGKEMDEEEIDYSET